MNYKKLYDNLVSTRFELKDLRLEERKQKIRYYEAHHITPKFMKGGDDVSNIVLLTFREHFLAHLLLYKHCKQQSTHVHGAYNSLQVMMIYLDSKPLDITSTSELYKYSKIYHNIKTKYWNTYDSTQHHMYGKTHSDDVKHKLSTMRVGMINVKDRDTGMSIGTVSNQHENVISGKWIHTSSGRVVGDIERQMRSNMGSGVNNNRYSGISTEYILNAAIEFYKSNNNIFVSKKWKDYCKQHNIRYGLKFRFGSHRQFIAAVEAHFSKNGIEFTYNPYDRSDTEKYKHNIKRIWVTNPQLSANILIRTRSVAPGCFVTTNRSSATGRDI